MRAMRTTASRLSRTISVVLIAAGAFAGNPAVRDRDWNNIKHVTRMLTLGGARSFAARRQHTSALPRTSDVIVWAQDTHFVRSLLNLSLAAEENKVEQTCGRGHQSRNARRRAEV